MERRGIRGVRDTVASLLPNQNPLRDCATLRMTSTNLCTAGRTRISTTVTIFSRSVSNQNNPLRLTALYKPSWLSLLLVYPTAASCSSLLVMPPDRASRITPFGFLPYLQTGCLTCHPYSHTRRLIAANSVVIALVVAAHIPTAVVLTKQASQLRRD
jgi:hypothetical protein